MSKEAGTTGPLVWIDMEMTGLDPDKDVIIEMATIVTDSHLEEIARGPQFIIHQPAKRFEEMDAWNQEHHKKSGLWDQVLTSTTTMAEAEQQTLAFLKEHCKPKTSPLCGNSVWQDRRFLFKHMPLLEAHLHYRIIDVSTLKELLNRWLPAVPKKSDKKKAHRALDDIEESIAELKLYRQLLKL